ncbi:MAG TPA: MarC family protein [Nitrososphaeraceae archaeon]|nr:MarC family protein [Nitrososphaeraceae archaeon]
MSTSLKSRIFYGHQKSKVILVIFLLCSVIGITSAIYYFNTVSLSNNDAVSDSPFANVSLQIQEFVNFIYSKFSSLFVTSNTFGEDLLKAVISLFVVVNPLGKVPLFVTLTERMEKQNKKLVSKNAIVTTAVLLTVFAVAGIQLLSIFGISIYSFMVAGGILLFIISIEFLTHGEWRYSGSSVSGDSGIIPLAFPLLAGPGAITTVMISLQAYGWIVSIISIVFVVLVTYLVLHVENPLLDSWK